MLSIIPTIVIQDIETNKIFNINENDIILSKIPNGMLTKPSLIWNINSPEILTNSEIDLNYLTNGISWETNYIATINNNNLNLNGWVTINNSSDIDYENYNLTVLSGNINKITEKHQYPKYMAKNVMLSSLDSSTNIEEKELSNYHIYKIPFKVNIPSLSKKQINLLNNNINNFEKLNKINLNSYIEGKQEFKFNQFIEFQNNIENGLGIALPKGVIRFYEKEDNKNYFIVSLKRKPLPSGSG